MSRLLFIVSRRESTFYEYLKQNFGDVGEVILDRRRGERRREDRGSTVERRQGDRRQQRVEEELQTTGWVIVRPTGD